MSNLAKLLRTAEYAVGAHDGVYRKSAKGEPYLVHPLRVAQHLANNGFNNVALLQAAILHDVVEDTNTPIGEIETVFGPAVAGLVAEVTDDKALSQVERKKAQVAHIVTMSAAAAAIKLADMYDNLLDIINSSPPAGWSVHKVQGYMVWKATIAERIAGMHPALDSLLEPIFAGSFSLDNVVHPAIPDSPDRETQLGSYYELLDQEAREKTRRENEKRSAFIPGGMLILKGNIPGTSDGPSVFNSNAATSEEATNHRPRRDLLLRSEHLEHCVLDGVSQPDVGAAAPKPE